MHMTWVMAEWWLVFVKIEQFMSRICRDVFCLRILSDAVWPCPASWLSQTRQWLMYTGQTGWLQCRRWPSAPVAGGTSWIAAGNTTSAGPCSRQTDVRTTSNPWSTSDTLLFRMVRGTKAWGGLRQSNIATILSRFSSRWFWLLFPVCMQTRHSSLF